MRFRFQGREIEARAGDTIAVALYRAGQRIFSRSFKYHRPRGLLCAAGKCPNCLMNVDGTPNVRTCITPVREGMQVRPQNAKPSLEHDWLAVTERFAWLMPVGWYYKTFQNPKVWHSVEPFIRRVAGLGEVGPTAHQEYEHTWMHAETAVVGGGYAGIQAAVSAAERGERVTLIDDQPELGGQTRYRSATGGAPSELISRLLSCSNLEVLKGCSCFGLYEGNLLGILQSHPHPGAAERLIHLRTQSVVVATGAYETPLLFPNNDRVGVMLSSAVQRLWRLHGIRAGKAAVVVGKGESAVEVAKDLKESGVEVRAIVAAEQVIDIAGSKTVERVLTSQGFYICDLVVLCGPRVPDAGLAAQAGGKLEWSDALGAFLPRSLPPNVSVVGEAAGEGITAASRLLKSGKKSFVCLCSDVTGQDLEDGVDEGFDHIETLKRYSTATMGPCQGRMCQLSFIGVCAGKTGRAMGETGVTTSRSPNPSVTLGALAGSRHHPIRRTALHHAHQELGAVWMDMGDWKRPRYYATDGSADEQSCVEQEYRAVRDRVGVIDVGTLGKLIVRGRDSGRLLDDVYTHSFSDLRPGRVRYGLICDEAGIILDDGTVSRLDDERYFITTTTGNLDFVSQWLEWRRILQGWEAQIINVTAGFGSINVAGPKAREVLQPLTGCDLSSSAFSYMACREAAVCGVPSILLRIGFVGETGWEVHSPAESAEAIWETLLAGGSPFQIRPFGVEAQRLLRLEKRHAIVGVDTDALADPFAAGLGWAAKLEKKSFVGKTALSRAATHSPRERLVGFVVPGRHVPADGSAVVAEGKPAGRVTSARYSPARKAAIGLAWVASDRASEGASIQVRIDGRLAVASVTLNAFYDPEGKRLRQ